MLKNRGVAVVSRRVGIPARRDRSFLLGAKWRGASFQHLKRNKDKVSFSERKRKFIFLLSAKGSENGKGLFSERGPHRKKFRWGICAPCNPKTPHTPTNEKRARGEQPPPYQRGQRRFVNKRVNETGTSTHQKTRWSL